MLLNKSSFTLQKQSSSFRGALRASGVMAFAGIGDAILYPILPVYGKELGFSIFFVGVLLSINRFVRILANTPIANIVNRIGMRKMLLVTSVTATLTTLTYGLALGLVSFLIARILWGLSFSGLKTATQNYAALSENKSGLAFGLSQGIVALGALGILWLGPILIAEFGVQNGLFLIASISLPGIVLAYSLPEITHRSTSIKARTTFHPNAINLLIFAMAISVEGTLVVTLSRLLSSGFSGTVELMAAVAFYLMLNKLFTFLFSIVGGLLTIRIKPVTIFITAILVCLVSLLFIFFGWIVLGIVLAFLSNTFITAFAPLMAIEGNGRDQDSLQAISSISTWRDFGAGLGAFLGIYTIELIGRHYLFLSLFIAGTLFFINYYIQHARSNNPII